jgi:hypothetical protein
MFPPQPKDNYGSNIRTESPFKAGLVRSVSKVPAAYSGPNASRSAFARALSDDASSQMRTQFDLDNAEYQSKAVKARAQDVQGRRESAVKAAGMDTQLGVANAQLDTQKRVTTRQQDMAYKQSQENLKSYMKRAKQDFVVNSLTGFASAAYEPLMDVAYGPTQSERYMALKAKYGGGPYEGITSGDILAAGAGYRGAAAEGVATPRLGSTERGLIRNLLTR